MNQRYEELVDEFDAKSDDGAVHEVQVFQTFTISKRLSGDSITKGGSKDFRLADGRDLNFVSDGVFEILETGQIIRRVA